MPTEERYAVPQAGQTVEVLLSKQMVRELRAHNEVDPAATNDELADRVEALLAGGRTTATATVKVTPKPQPVAISGDGPVTTLAPSELVKVQCPELGHGTMWFCACDLGLSAALNH